MILKGKDGTIPVSKVAEAIAKYGINTDKVNPLLRLSRIRRQEHGNH